jgi:NAD(P)-dependent dehydrogenase (short-subunit alcohol dehydrogenase family)
VVLVTGGGSGIGAAAAQRLAHEGAAAAPKPGRRRAILDAVDLALLPGCVPGVYRWRLDPATSAAA